jgi:hypothetical protein
VSKVPATLSTKVTVSAAAQAGSLGNTAGAKSGTRAAPLATGGQMGEQGFVRCTYGPVPGGGSGFFAILNPPAGMTTDDFLGLTIVNQVTLNVDSVSYPIGGLSLATLQVPIFVNTINTGVPSGYFDVSYQLIR